MKKTKDISLQSKRLVAVYDKEVHMTVSSTTPDKWLFVDLETGDVWHRKEDIFNQKKGNFWRGATEQEIKELRKLKI